MKVGIDISEDLHTQVKVKAAQRGLKMKDAWREALETWVRSSEAPADPEFDEQIRYARETMGRYRKAFEELAK